MSLKFTENQAPKMTASSIRPVREKEKNVKEQKNLQQKEVAMVSFFFFFSLCPRAGGGEDLEKHSMLGRFL